LFRNPFLWSFPMTATHEQNSTMATVPVLYCSLELGSKDWKLAFTSGLGQKPRLRTIKARDTDALLAEIEAAKKRFGLPENTAIVSCYEAGRDGFWLHRFLLSRRIENLVVDSSSIEVNRRKRRAKSDRLDAVKLVEMLIRWCNGERKVWGVVHAPTVADEDRRQLHRELIVLKTERTAHVNAIKGLLAGLGLQASVDDNFPERLKKLRQWDDSPVPPALSARLLREFERWQLAGRQIRELEQERTRQIRHEQTPEVLQVRQLLNLRGIGENGAWLLVNELFAWRRFQNRRQVGSIAGLAPTPYDSGESRREQGISKAGNRRLRWMMVQLSWCWLQYQPGSELSQWYQRRFGGGNKRVRKIGIVALARKLLVALWKYLETGQPPAGAEVIGWDQKPKFAGASQERKKAS
jgi:transposase